MVHLSAEDEFRKVQASHCQSLPPLERSEDGVFDPPGARSGVIFVVAVVVVVVVVVVGVGVVVVVVGEVVVETRVSEGFLVPQAEQTEREFEFIKVHVEQLQVSDFPSTRPLPPTNDGAFFSSRLFFSGLTNSRLHSFCSLHSPRSTASLCKLWAVSLAFCHGKGSFVEKIT